jgi:putative ATP-dependent endonuclease of OLD family
MKLETLRVRNFRCYGDEVSISFADLTALIGRNDAGKSSLMDALDIFLNEGVPDSDDASKNGNASDLAIICEFSGIPSSVVIDDSNPTSLQVEGLLNEIGRLEIHKVFSGHLQKPKCENIQAYAVHPTAENVADLLQLKNPTLKKRAKELGVDLEGVDQKVNADIRKRIREHVGELDPAPSFVPLNDENGKKVWTELKKYLPALALFKSDRASTDQDSEAQDPLKAAIKEALKEKEAELKVITDHVHEQVKAIAQETLKKLREMDPNLASELNPTFPAPKWEGLFKASITGDDDIPINKRGSGVKRLVLLSFFRAKAEQAAKKAPHASVIYAIEEPETSQHPHNQRLLLRALMELSSEYQVVLTTHTPMLARSLPDTSLRYVHVEDDGSRSIKVGGPETNSIFARALGVLPDSSVKMFIGVEGPNDIAFLLGISAALRLHAEDVPDLEQLETDGKIIFFPLGGSTLALWTSRLEHLNRPEFHIFDRDTSPPNSPKYQQFSDEINQRDDCVAVITERLEIENYLHIDAIRATYFESEIELARANNFGPFEDVPYEVAKLVHAASDSQIEWEALDEEKKGKKESRVKKALCSRASRKMTPALLDAIDENGDVRAWLLHISNTLV